MCCKLSKTILSIVLIFVVWTLLDMLIHGVWLAQIYKETAALWRPMNEMKMGLMHLVTLLMAIPFTIAYTILVSPKTLCRGVRWGMVFGVVVGLGAGFGSYSVMPIPLSLAWGWFGGTVLEFACAGLILGLLLKDNESSSCCMVTPKEVSK
ncbi:MAG: hypothetical protein ACOY3I_05130 [Verrucomicrobiota bacterium]